MATSVTLCSISQSRSCSSALVVVANVRTSVWRWLARAPGVRTHALTSFLDTSNPAQRSCRRSTTGSLPVRYGYKGPARERAVKDRQKSLRHVLYGNNPRSLTRRLQAKLLNERTASRRKRHALGRARPHFPRPAAAPEGAYKTAQIIANVMLVLMLMLRPCGARW